MSHRASWLADWVNWLLQAIISIAQTAIGLFYLTAAGCIAVRFATDRDSYEDSVDLLPAIAAGVVLLWTGIKIMPPFGSAYHRSGETADSWTPPEVVDPAELWKAACFDRRVTELTRTTRSRTPICPEALCVTRRRASDLCVPS
jgi:hypothetical protein